VGTQHIGEEKPVDLRLLFGLHVIGIIEGAFWSDNTGFGVFRLSDVQSDSPSVERVRRYIAFSEDWHRRLEAESNYSNAEWEAFRDVYESEQWHTVASDGTMDRISGPVFVCGEVTWGPSPPRT
jgi:hypothetical protein